MKNKLTLKKFANVGLIILMIAPPSYAVDSVSLVNNQMVPATSLDAQKRAEVNGQSAATAPAISPAQAFEMQGPVQRPTTPLPPTPSPVPVARTPVVVTPSLNGYTPAASNPNFGFREDIVTVVRNGQAFQQTILKIRNLSTGETSDLGPVEYPFSFIKKDVSRDGSLVYFASDSAYTPGSLTIYRVAAPQTRLALFGEFQDISFLENGNISVTIRQDFRNGTVVGNTYQVDKTNLTYSLANTSLILQGTALLKNGYLVIPEQNTYSNSYHVTVFDASKGANQLTQLPKEISYHASQGAGGSGGGGSYTMIDTYKTPTDRTFVTVAISAQGNQGVDYSQTFIFDPATGEQLLINGAAARLTSEGNLSPEYVGNIAKYKITHRDGTTEDVSVDLRNLQIVPNLPAGWMRMPGNVLAAFKIENGQPVILNLANNERRAMAVSDITSMNNTDMLNYFSRVTGFPTYGISLTAAVVERNGRLTPVVQVAYILKWPRGYAFQSQGTLYFDAQGRIENAHAAVAYRPLEMGEFLEGKCTQPEQYAQQASTSCVGVAITSGGLREIHSYNSRGNRGLSIYDIERGTASSFGLQGYGAITAANFSKDGKYLAASSGMNAIRVIDLVGNKNVGGLLISVWPGLEDPGVPTIDRIQSLGANSFSIHTNDSRGPSVVLGRTFDLVISTNGQLQLNSGLPDGWTRAASNPNYALKLETSGLSQTLYLKNLQTWVDQTLINAWGGGQYPLRIVSAYDVSSDGLAVIYGTTQPADIYVQSITTPIKKVRLPGELKSVEFLGEKLVRINYVDGQGVNKTTAVDYNSMSILKSEKKEAGYEILSGYEYYLVVNSKATIIPGKSPLHADIMLESVEVNGSVQMHFRYITRSGYIGDSFLSYNKAVGTFSNISQEVFVRALLPTLPAGSLPSGWKRMTMNPNIYFEVIQSSLGDYVVFYSLTATSFGRYQFYLTGPIRQWLQRFF